MFLPNLFMMCLYLIYHSGIQSHFDSFCICCQEKKQKNNIGYIELKPDPGVLLIVINKCQSFVFGRKCVVVGKSEITCA